MKGKKILLPKKSQMQHLLNNYTIKVVADFYLVSEPTIYRWIEKYKFYTKDIDISKNYSAKSIIDNTKYQALRKEGKSLEDISKELGVDKDLVVTYAKRIEARKNDR